MPLINQAELAKKTKNNEYCNLYYFFGKDIASIELYTKRLVDRLLKNEDREFCFHSYEGKNISLSQFYDDCELLPFGAQRNVIAVNDLNAEELGANDLKFLTDALNNLAETTTVIIYITGIDLYAGKKYMTAKNKKLCDICAKKGIACDFQLKTGAEAAKSVISCCQKQGCVISKQAADRLISLCLGNTVLINNEIDKLCSFVNGGEITTEIVNEMVAKQLDTNSFELAKAAVKFDTKKAMRLLNELYEQQLDSNAIIYAMGMSFTDLYRARVAVSSARNKSDICSDFNYKGREFAVENAIRDCSKLPIERIRKCIDIIAQTDIELKSSRTNNRIIVEKAVIKMLNKENYG